MKSRGRETRPRIPQDQLADYQLTCESLRKANFDAAQLVIALAQMHADAEHCRCLYRKLRATVLQMNLCVEACERMAKGGFDPPRVQVEFIFVPPHNCDVTEGLDEFLGTEEEGPPTPDLDPTWGEELDALLRVTRTAVRLLSGSAALSARATQGALACLGGLSRVLVRQRLHVAVMGIMPTEVDFITAQECDKCGRDLSDCN